MITASEFLTYLEVFNVQFGHEGPIAIPVPLSQGGTQAALVASNNALFYSNSTTGALLPSVANRAFMTDGSGNIGWGTTFPQGISCLAPLSNGQLANKAYVDFSVGVLQGEAVLKSGSTMTGFLILNANPSSDPEAANKAYVDAVAAGLTPAGPVTAASTVDVPASYYNGVGNDGIGATLTMSAGVITLDGVATILGGRYLFKDQTDATTQGIYDCTTEGDVSTQAVFTRSTNYDTPTQINSTGIVPVISGSTQAGQGFYQINTIVTIGTTDFDYIKFGNAGTVTSITAGAGLSGGTITGSGTIAIDAIASLNFLANPTGGSAVPVAYPFSSYATYLFANYINAPVSTVIVTGSTATVATRDIYIIKASGLCTLTIPSGIVPGNMFQIVGYTGGWKLAQGTAGMQILWGDRATTVGTSGYLASENDTDGVTLTCVDTDTFIVTNPSASVVVF